MGSKFFFNLDAIKPQKSYAGGSLTCVTGKEVPGFEGISFAHLKLNKNGHLSPIWHPNANKIGYCLKGNAMVTIRGPSEQDVFTVQKGDIFFVPKGSIHHITNIDNGECSISFAFSHTHPETMTLTNTMVNLSDEVFLATFGSNVEFLKGLKNTKQELITTLTSVGQPPKYISDRFKFNLDASAKPVLTKGGYLQIGTHTNLPVLDGVAILTFGLNDKGCVEPHWHTNAGELIFIIKGKTRITVVSPDGEVNIMEVSAGQGAFAPASHFHNIQNIGSEDVEVAAFFSNADPDYIGIAEAVGCCNNDVLASIFNVPANYFDEFNKVNQPLVIVPV